MAMEEKWNPESFLTPEMELQLIAEWDIGIWVKVKYCISSSRKTGVLYELIAGAK